MSAMHKYQTIIYWSDADQAFLAEVPALPGCAAQRLAVDLCARWRTIKVDGGW